MKKHIRPIFALFILLSFLLTLFTGCSEKADGDSDEKSKDKDSDDKESSSQHSSRDEDDEEAFQLEGKDVFNGKRYSEMLWGYYETVGYEYNGSFDDSKEFRDGMKYVTVKTDYGPSKISALPISMQAGKYSHFLSSFSYEGDYYDCYTPEGRAMFRKAYMAEVGDLSEADFLKIEKILDQDVASLTFVEENGANKLLMYAYEIQGNKLRFYSFSVDDSFNMTIGDKPELELAFLHDGGKLMMAYDGVQRDYKTDGYQEGDPSLYFSGYASNAKNQYQDLVGFTFSQFGLGSDISIYVDLENGESPVDPVMELDVDTGKFTLSWQQRWANQFGHLEEVDDARTITGTLIPCTNYGFTSYCGFILIVDGTQYKYLMSEKEYEELIYAGLGDTENMTSMEIEDLTNAKQNILAELEAAFKNAGLDVTIDEMSGKVALEANFLFATDSYDLTQDGQEYLNTFVDVYTSVVLRDEYKHYISSIIIEGHTDTSGSYSYNKTLSQHRADAVASHCIARNGQIASIIEASGCSFDYPVYNEDGSVNMAASRRVTFRFALAGY